MSIFVCKHIRYFYKSVNLESSFRQTKWPHIISFFFFICSNHKEHWDCLETDNDEVWTTRLSMFVLSLSSDSRSYDRRIHVEFLKHDPENNPSRCVVVCSHSACFFWFFREFSFFFAKKETFDSRMFGLLKGYLHIFVEVLPYNVKCSPRPFCVVTTRTVLHDRFPHLFTF